MFAFDIISFALRTGNRVCAYFTLNSGCGSAWLERLVWDQEVAGSNPVTPTYKSFYPVSVAQLDRATAF